MSPAQNHLAAVDEDEEACMTVLKIIMSKVLPKALKAAIELDLLEIIVGAGPNAYLSPADITVQLPTDNPEAPMMVDRILRLLASYSVVSCSITDSIRRFGAAPITKFLTRNEDGLSLAALALMSEDRVSIDLWYCLKDVVLDGGIAFDKTYGMPAFEYHGTDSSFNKLFNEGMKGHSTIIMKKILERYEGFEGVNVLVDIGGGTGASLYSILCVYPHIKGINYDLPHVISQAPALPGVEHVGGDMFDTIPAGDAIFMKWILHNWSDQHCVKVLKNCWKALPDNGKMIVVESILPEIPETTAAAQSAFDFDVLMLAHFGGRERTAKEFECLAKEAGFCGFKASRSYCNFWVIEFFK